MLAILLGFFATEASASLVSAVATPGQETAAATRTVHLTWNASTDDVIGYRVYRGSTDGGPYTSYTVGPVVDLSFDDTTAKLGETYYYVVTALDVNGFESAYSNQITIFVPPHIVHLSWNPSTDNVIGYRVYRGVMDGGPYTSYTVGPVESLAFNDTTAIPGTTYYYVATSLDPLGNESIFSDEVVVSVPEP